MRRTLLFPAGLFAAGVLVVALAACTTAVGGQAAAIAAPVDVSAFVPSAQDPDPSVRIEGVVAEKFPGAHHVRPEQRVAYTFMPPIGGTHDQAWASCNGVVYPEPVRSENMVHSLEHGAVWIAYDPEQVDDDGVSALAARVADRPYLLMSPYPGMEQPVSLQSWGHQLTVADARDPRIDQFIAALRQNPNTFPEPGASCQEVGPPYFEQAAPPPFAPAPSAAEVDGTTVLTE